jgi:D-psicose/D-tagatose/L-ribulose 3-epimerase
MRFGASSFVWVSPFGDDELWLAERVRQLGFDVLELCVEDPARVTADAVRRAAEDAGVGVSVCGAFGADRDVSHPDPGVRRGAVGYLDACVALAAAVGSPHVAGPMYAETGVARLQPPDERRATRERAADALREVAERAGELGVGRRIQPGPP